MQGGELHQVSSRRHLVLYREHGGGRRCQHEGCLKAAQPGGTPHCRAHGGGRRCKEEDCTKGAKAVKRRSYNMYVSASEQLEHHGVKHGAQRLHDVGRQQRVHVILQMFLGILRHPSPKPSSQRLTTTDDEHAESTLYNGMIRTTRT